MYIFLPVPDKAIGNTTKYALYLRRIQRENSNDPVKMNISSFRLIVAELDPVDFIFTLFFCTNSKPKMAN